MVMMKYVNTCKYQLSNRLSNRLSIFLSLLVRFFSAGVQQQALCVASERSSRILPSFRSVRQAASVVAYEI